ncbi:hypothetical protein SPHINGO361_140206 [Sphingomonas sp. EC-HK361]|nr:hypothetical protein SPHINGO361_140206 [Sphingomonas sp. EC-HK361]
MRICALPRCPYLGDPQESRHNISNSFCRSQFDRDIRRCGAAVRATCTEAILAHSKMARLFAGKALKLRHTRGSAEAVRRPTLRLQTSRA